MSFRTVSRSTIGGTLLPVSIVELRGLKRYLEAGSTGSSQDLGMSCLTNAIGLFLRKFHCAITLVTLNCVLYIFKVV